MAATTDTGESAIFLLSRVLSINGRCMAVLALYERNYVYV